MLDTMYAWCRKWRMKVNVKKTKIVHFRNKGSARTKFKFKYGANNVDIVENYKYLGLILDEFLDYNITSSVLASSAGRALGSIQNKFNVLKGLGYDTFTKMFYTGVAPVMDYCSGIWGFKEYSKVESVQNRAARFYLGVHRYAPNHAVKGDIGWLTPNLRHKIEMIRYWNRLLSMSDNRLTKQVFLWDKRLNKRNWCSEISHILSSINLQASYINNIPVDIDRAKEALLNKYIDEWKTQVENVPKLRTYVLFKSNFEVEPFVYKVQNRGHRAILAQFRSGILPLAIETGRYNNVPLEDRLCVFCNDNVLENETHFLLHCNFYNEYRGHLMSEIIKTVDNYYFMSTEEKLCTLLNPECIKFTAEFLYKAYFRRKFSLYK